MLLLIVISEPETDFNRQKTASSDCKSLNYEADSNKVSDLYGGYVSLSLCWFSAIPPPNKSTRAHSGIQQLSGI